MPIDFNNAPHQGSFSTRQIENPNYISDLKRRMESNARQILEYLFPNGKLIGNEYHIGDFSGSTGDSTKISLTRNKVGVGQDFATGESTADLIDVWALGTGRIARRESFSEIIEEIEEWLGNPKVVPMRKVDWASEQKASQGEEWWKAPPSATYIYNDADGHIIGYVNRYDYEKNGEAKKATIPFIGKKAGAPEIRPLYHQDKICSASTIVWAEGEKAVNALASRGIPATTSMGGSNVPGNKIDWSPIKGKAIIVWPDADEPGLKYAEMVAIHAKQSGAKEIRILSLPDGLEEGWDAADAIEEGIDVRAFIENHDPGTPVRSRLEFKSALEYHGEPKKVEWLVVGSIPLGQPGMVAAMGDTGKSYLLLDLCVRVACGETPIDTPIFGGRVTGKGTAVYITSEDSDDEIHRRLNSIDPGLRRIHQCSDRLKVLPLPDRGGAAPIMEQNSRGVFETDNWTEIKNSLLEIDDLRLVVFDPLQSFCLADINADPAASQYFCSMLTSLSSQTGATAIVSHHMRKPTQKNDGRTLSPSDAREMIRGTSALVDGMRFAYALWTPSSSKEARAICKRMDRQYTPNCLVYGAMVKANGQANREVSTYLRSPFGLLIDQTDRSKSIAAMSSEDFDDLVACVKEAAEAGHPFNRTGLSSAFKRKEDIPEAFRETPRAVLEEIIDKLIVEGKIVTCNAGGKIKNVLDVPGGLFAQGVGQFEPGTYQAFRAQA